MVYEIATGLPPNVDIRVPYGRLGPHSKFHVPRLEAGNYSKDLRGLVAYCLEELPVRVLQLTKSKSIPTSG